MHLGIEPGLWLVETSLGTFNSKAPQRRVIMYLLKANLVISESFRSDYNQCMLDFVLESSNNDFGTGHFTGRGWGGYKTGGGGGM